VSILQEREIMHTRRLPPALLTCVIHKLVLARARGTSTTYPFNCHAEVDYSVLDSIPRHETQHHMGEVPTWTKLKNAIRRMVNDKAPGKSGLTTDILKNLPPKAFQFYVNLIQ
jgi:hypothetical protein